MTLSDNWKLDSGIREQVTSFTIHMAYFSTTANYQEGNVIRLYLIGLDEDGEPFTYKMTVGADWSSSDGGKTISHPTKTRINRNSTYGHWLNSSMTIPPLVEELSKRDSGNGPLSADIWVGLVLKLGSIQVQFGKPSTDNPPRTYLVPVEFLGLADENSQNGVVTAVQSANMQSEQTAPVSATSAAERVAAARAAQSAKSAPLVQTQQLPQSPILQQLLALAANSPNHEAFVNEALVMDEVLADEELALAVATPNGIYKQAKG